jgi:hypothetical protein
MTSFIYSQSARNGRCFLNRRRNQWRSQKFVTGSAYGERVLGARAIIGVWDCASSGVHGQIFHVTNKFLVSLIGSAHAGSAPGTDTANQAVHPFGFG